MKVVKFLLVFLVVGLVCSVFCSMIAVGVVGNFGQPRISSGYSDCEKTLSIMPWPAIWKDKISYSICQKDGFLFESIYISNIFNPNRSIYMSKASTGQLSFISLRDWDYPGQKETLTTLGDATIESVRLKNYESLYFQALKELAISGAMRY